MLNIRNNLKMPHIEIIGEFNDEQILLHFNILKIYQDLYLIL